MKEENKKYEKKEVKEVEKEIKINDTDLNLESQGNEESNAISNPVGLVMRD